MAGARAGEGVGRCTSHVPAGAGSKQSTFEHGIALARIGDSGDRVYDDDGLGGDEEDDERQRGG